MILELLIRISVSKMRLDFGRFPLKKSLHHSFAPKNIQTSVHFIKRAGSRYPGHRKKRTAPRALYLLTQPSFRQLINIVQHDASSDCYAIHRVFSHKDRHFKLFGQQHIDAMQKGSTSC